MTLTTDRDGRGPACRRAGRGFQCLPSLSGRGAGGEVFGPWSWVLGQMSPSPLAGEGQGVRALVFACLIAAGCWSANLGVFQYLPIPLLPIRLGRGRRELASVLEVSDFHLRDCPNFRAPTRHRPGADAAGWSATVGVPTKMGLSPSLAHWVAGDWSIFRPNDQDLHIRHGPKTWTCPPPATP